MRRDISPTLSGSDGYAVTLPLRQLYNRNGLMSTHLDSMGSRLYQARLDLAARRRETVALEEVAQDIGVSSVTVGRWEKGTRKPTLAQLERLAAFYGSTPEWLAFGRGERFFPTLDEPGAAARRVARAANQATQPLEPRRKAKGQE
ncbi:MAG: helix-turn-helix domain-containing protein [Gemmatimonadales bacterium]|nr:helix-turn-helix domain-containing protein [Gemmatimonadales bacterium]